jgi:hypothetical protein
MAELAPLFPGGGQDEFTGAYTGDSTGIHPPWLEQSTCVLGPAPEVGVMAKRPQGLLNVVALSARMAVLRSCALGI